ncbi:MAG: hypothetical protein COA57_11650 [Flavobacteriales bacterium]|nr:MAG: hypothetical protein COA57_11650 [Flavobacteriales bacterium]
MIPKAEILQLAQNYELLPTTVHKDYALGWLLRAISVHPQLSTWVFKGGTCLKKCYFETYRFSEDLDFTIPADQEIDVASIQKYLEEAVAEIEANSGLTFPRAEWKIEEYKNPRGNTSYQVKIPFEGPMQLQKKSLQRVKFDLTQDELLADDPTLRNLHHNYTDALEPAPQVLCYSINEILAEKTRALVERNGRARDVYDVVNISRNFRSEISSQRTVELANAKFEFKGLPAPSVEYVIGAIDMEILSANWGDQLAHQINNLPPVESYITDLQNSIAWWLQPEVAEPQPGIMPEAAQGGVQAERQMFPGISAAVPPSAMDQIRRAARNRFLVRVFYNGAERLVEPYSLRYPATGNEILHVWEVEKNGARLNGHKSYKTHQLTYLSTSDQAFVPQWEVEL